MARRRRTPEQIIRKLAEGQKLLAAGSTVEEVCRQFQIAESTWARWLNQYGGMKADDAKRLKQLEKENAELKRLLADAELGLFRGLCNRLPVLELTQNRRQRSSWERSVVDQLRDGDTSRAVAGYADHGRLTVVAPDELAGRVLTHWQHLVDRHGAESVVVIARTRRQVDHLNRAARQRRIDAGHVTGPEVATPDGARFAAGDRVACLRNDRRLDVDNGTRATIVAVDPDGALTIRPDRHGRPVTLPTSYLAEGNLAHGYAITGHKAQGLTVDHALVVADETIDGEWGYVAMSRGRHTNHLYLTDTDRADPRRHAPEPVEDPADGLARRLRVSRADTPLVDRDVYDPVETAIRWQQLAHSIHDARQVEHERRTLQRQLDELADQKQHLRVRYARDHERQEEATSGLSRLTRASRRERDRLDAALEGYVDRADRIDEQSIRIRRQLARLDDRPDLADWEAEAGRLRDVLDAVAADNVRRHERQTPQWLVDTLGAPPEHPVTRAVWREAATRVEAFRVRWQIDEPDHAIGPPPVSDAQGRDRAEVVSRLGEAVREITCRSQLEAERDLSVERRLSRGIGL